MNLEKDRADSAERISKAWQERALKAEQALRPCLYPKKGMKQTAMDLADAMWGVTEKPTLVPLEPSDVPPGSVVRRIDYTIHGQWLQVTEVHGTGVRIGTIAYRWEALQESFQILRPGNPEWKPCSKPQSSPTK